MSQFEDLLAQLSAVEDEQAILAKSIPGVGSEDDNATLAAGANDEETLDDDSSQLTKSMVVDGEEVQLVDAEELIKSLEGLTVRVTEQEDVLAKGLTTSLKLIQRQGELIKSLQAEVKAIGSQGAGRKAAMMLGAHATAIETPLAKSESAGLTKEEFLAKSEAAWKAGKLTGHEFNTIDVSMRQGHAPDAALVAKALS